MGMAASQARLLSLTGRLHDVELKAQSIESQKIALATQKDELYEEYNAALDATKIQIAVKGDDALGKSWVTADFRTLCTYQEGNKPYRDYGLRDNKTGLLYETQEVVDNYDKFGNDKYSFAWAMLGYADKMTSDGDNSVQWLGTNTQMWGDKGFQIERSDAVHGSCSSVMTKTEWDIYDQMLKEGEVPDNLQSLYDKIVEEDANGDTEARSKALKAFREELYNTEAFRTRLLATMEETGSEKTWNTDIASEFNYWCRKWDAIHDAGGCIAIEPQYESGDKSAQWLQNMVESGQVTIIESKDIQGSRGSWSDTSVATSTNGNYLKSVEDEKGRKKAEAKYEHELDIINRKDTKFDTELSKLETERTSITTEMDSIKKVRDDNIDRTFGIFS